MSASAVMVAATLIAGPSWIAPRGNDVLTSERGIVYAVGASVRLAGLLAGGRGVIQPFGFGAALHFRLYGLYLGPLRIGGAAHLGHSHFLERRTVAQPDAAVGEQSAVRWAALGHTDFTAGPSIQLPVGPVLLEGGAGVGLGISSFDRPLGPFPSDEEQFIDYSLMLRGGGQVGIPLRDNQGIVVGFAVQRFFSALEIVRDPDPAVPEAEPDTHPFDLMLEGTVGYQMWF